MPKNPGKSTRRSARLAGLLQKRDGVGTNDDEQLSDDVTELPYGLPKITNPNICSVCERQKNSEKFFASIESSSKSWATTLIALQGAVDEGCRWCTLIYEAVTTYMDGVHDLTDTSIAIFVWRPRWDRLGLDVELAPVSVAVEIWKNDNVESDMLELFYIKDDDPLSKSPKHESLFNIETKEMYPDDPTCDEAIHPARIWIDDCVQNHTQCSDSNASLPKRVLELGESKIVLKEGLGTNGYAKYACLSHSWGPQGPTSKLTSETEEESRQGIEISELPKTFAEAAKVCLKLGIPYLWIDALCIRQDDPVDWKEAAATMASVYENAFVTIAALTGGGSNAGLRSLVKSSFKVTKLRNSDIHVRQQMQEFPNFMGYWRHASKMVQQVWPLLTRGWVYQERRLSPRILYFSANQLVWECRAVRIMQDGSYNRSWEIEGPEGSRTDLRDLSINMKDPVSSWEQGVEEYSALHLTYETDRLVALAALAQRMLKIRRTDDYIAGVWRSSLLSDLGWSSAFNTSLDVHPIPGTHTPTWSWASLQGAVRYKYSPPHIAPNVRLVDLTYSTIGPIHLGDVRDASITLRGPVLDITTETADDDWGQPSKLNDFPLSDAQDIEITKYADFDFVKAGLPLPEAGETYKAIIIYDGDLREWLRSAGIGIILRKTSSESYRRVGLCVILATTIREDGQKELSEESRELINDFIASLAVEEVKII